MRPKWHWSAFLCFVTLGLFLNALCFVPHAFAAGTVTYDYGTNGGYAAEVDLTTLQGTKDARWQFAGWNTNPNAEEALAPGSLTGSEVTLFAIYKKTLRATFQYLDKTEHPAEVTIYNNSHGGEVDNPPEQLFDNGWNLRGWSRSPELAANPEIPLFLDADNDDTAFFGLYERQITLTYDANGGSFAAGASQYEPPPVTQFVNSANPDHPTIDILEVADSGGVSKSGNAFAYWALDSKNGQRYDPGAGVTMDQSHVLVAVWEANQYTITLNYEANGGTETGSGKLITQMTAAANTALSLPLTAERGIGWNLTGWNTDKNANTGWFDGNAPASPETAEQIWAPVMSERFPPGTAVNTLNWGAQNTQTSLLADDSGRGLIVQSGYMYINRPAMNNYAVEFELTKALSGGDSLFMVQFRTASNLTTGTFERSIIFRYNVNEIRSQVGGTPTETLVSREGHMISDNSTIHVRLEVLNGEIIVKTRFSPEEEYVQRGNPVLMGIPGETHVAFRKNNAEVYINNVTLYQALAPSHMTLYAIYEKELTADFRDCDGTITVSDKLYNRETGKSVSVPALREYPGWNPTGWSGSPNAGAVDAVELEAGSDYKLTEDNTGKTWYGLYERRITLSYDANGGSFAAEASQYEPLSIQQYLNSSAPGSYTGESFAVADSDGVSRPGYTFAYWALDSENGPGYDPGARITIDQNRVLVAVWEATAPPIIPPANSGNLIPDGDFEAFIPFGNFGNSTPPR